MGSRARIKSSSLGRWAKTLCVLCALMCLPIATLQWSMSVGPEHTPLKSWTARRCPVGALFGRGGSDLREMLRGSQRSRAGFLSLNSRSTRVSTLRGSSAGRHGGASG